MEEQLVTLQSISQANPVDLSQFPDRMAHNGINCSELVVGYMNGTANLRSNEVDGVSLLPDLPYGVAVGNLKLRGRYSTAYGDPKLLAGFLIGDPGLAYTALRMMRAPLRTGRRTSDLVLRGELRDVVEPSSLDWGDVTEQGCTVVGRGELQVVVGFAGWGDKLNLAQSSALAYVLADRLEKAAG